MLNAMINVHQDNPNRLSLREVHGAAYINMYEYIKDWMSVMLTNSSVTAHDVLAITIRATLYHLCKNQICYQKLVSEIRTADAAGNISSPAKYNEISTLPYL